MRGKLIVIEGTDCSGKETQTTKLIERLEDENIKVMRMSFPNYDTPTGRIVGGPYLGKQYICNGFFKEGAANVDPKVASLYYAADRYYSVPVIKNALNRGKNVVLDRYSHSNMAHQGGKLSNSNQRKEFYEFIDKLEFDLLELPKPDIIVFLHVPHDIAFEIKKNRPESDDQHEVSIEHLKNAEASYLELCELYNYKRVDCTKNGKFRSIDDISDEVYDYVKEQLD
jgi:dTMP kinase